jgi:2'-5' RNA ligase
VKRSNIFDPIQKELDQKVFNGIDPRPRIVKFIEEEIRKVLTPLLGFDPMEFIDLYLTGSLTTYQYGDTSDCDTSVFVQWDLWPTGADPNTIRRTLIPIIMDKLDGTNLPGTQHPIQHFIVPPGVEPHDLYKPGLRSAWSFRDHKWLVPPERDRVHDISVELPVLYRRAEDMADKMENLLAYDPIYAKEFWHQIHRKRQMDQQKGLGDFSEGNIVYKYLLHNGYFDRIRDELGEKISKTAKKMYHYRSKGWDDYVRENGLPPTDPNPLGQNNFPGNPEAVYLFELHPDDPQMHEIGAEHDPSKGDLYEVNVEGLPLEPDQWLPHAWYHRGPIPPERVKKIATGLPGEPYVPRVGEIWTISNPFAGAMPHTRDQPRKQSFEVLDVDDDEIWLRDVDTYEERTMPMTDWHKLVWRGIAYRRNQDWQLQQTPEEAADLWPDTLPANWSMVREADTQRLFLAYELPPEIVRQVNAWQQTNLPPGVHAEPSTNLHMTIAFLGDTDTAMVPHLQQILGEIDPSQVMLSGPIEYRELDKLAFLALQDNGGNEVVEQINEKLGALMGYEPQFRPWLPHITVWRFGPDHKPNLQPQLPNFGSFTPVGVHVYTSVKNPAGGATYQKVAAPQVMYHVAASADRDSIQRLGLVSPHFRNDPDAVQEANYFWSDYDTALSMFEDGSPNIDIWAVDVNGLRLIPDPEYDRVENGLPEDYPGVGKAFYTLDPIGPERLSLVSRTAKTADDLSWVDKSSPYGTPDGGFIGGPEHPGDDPIGDQPTSVPQRDTPEPGGNAVLKVIYDFQRDQIILGDKRMSDQFPPGQIIGEYYSPDVYLNDHATAWFNPGYFKRLWTHSFPDRQVRHVILDKGEGQHEVVHHGH